MGCRPDAAPTGSEDGFGLIEALVGMLILMVVLVSLANLLTDSLSVALTTKQREQAASLAGDVAENAKALGRTCLTGGTCPTFTAGTFALVKGTEATLAASNSYAVDGTTYTVAPAVSCGGATCSTSSSGPVSVAVTVTWSQAARSYSYVTSTLVSGN